MPQRNVVSGNAMFVVYAHNGFCKDAFKIFELMKYFGIYLDTWNFSFVICACNHADLVNVSCAYFNHMGNPY